MHLPCLKKSLFAVPVLVASGLALACGVDSPRTPQPAGIPAPGISLPVPQPTAPSHYYPTPQSWPVLPTAYPSAPAVPTWNLSVADGRLLLQVSEDSRSACERLTLLVGGADPTEVTVADNKIRLTGGKDVKDGNFLHATAQRVTRGGPDGAVLTLLGEAKLVYVRQGKKLEASAEHVSVNLATGQVVGEMGYPAPPAACPAMPCVPVPPADTKPALPIAP